MTSASRVRLLLRGLLAVGLAVPVVAASAFAPAPAAAAGVPRCTASQLEMRFAVGGAAAGTAYGDLVITDRSRTACSLRGLPTVSFIADAAVVGAAGVRYRYRTSRAAVVLHPGSVGHAVVRIGIGTAADHGAACRRVRVDALRLHVPASGFLRSRLPSRTSACADPDIRLLSSSQFLAHRTVH